MKLDPYLMILHHFLRLAAEVAAKAVWSHTGTLTGTDSVLNAAFRRAGVLRVNTIADLFDMAEVLSNTHSPGQLPGARCQNHRGTLGRQEQSLHADV